MVGLVGVLLLRAGAGLGLIWRQHSVRLYRERYEAAEALRANEVRYRRTLDNMMEGFQIIGFDWRYLYLNDSAARCGRQAKEEDSIRMIQQACAILTYTRGFNSVWIALVDETEPSLRRRRAGRARIASI